MDPTKTMAREVCPDTRRFEQRVKRVHDEAVRLAVIAADVLKGDATVSEYTEAVNDLRRAL